MLIFIVMKNNMLSQDHMFDGATSFDQRTLNCEWKRNPSFMSGTNVCTNGANCGSGNTTCPTTDSPRAFETKDELKAAVNSYCAGLNPDDSEYG